MIFAGIILYIFGSIGNILNICVFTIWSRSPQRFNKHHKTSRTTNSSLYLLASSFANLIVIIYPLLTRIIFDGYQYHLTQTNVFILCKLRYYALHTFDLMSLTCICMATFDRYLISSRKVRLRELCTTKKQTIIIILLIVLFIGLHNISIAIYFNISNTDQCRIFSTIYLHYYLYVIQIFFHGIIPIIFLFIFGILLFKQLRNLKTQVNHNENMNRNKQVSHMLLLMSIRITLSSIPYCVEKFYDIMIHYDNYEGSSNFLR